MEAKLSVFGFKEYFEVQPPPAREKFPRVL
jgi:hypothetical protein